MNAPNTDAKDRLFRLIAGVLANEIPFNSFVEDYEQVFNFELEKASVPPNELSPLRELFDVVVFFSQYPEDLAAYPGYKTESQVREATSAAAAKLSLVRPA